jgi:hypothetical protein
MKTDWTITSIKIRRSPCREVYSNIYLSVRFKKWGLAWDRLRAPIDQQIEGQIFANLRLFGNFHEN